MKLLLDTNTLYWLVTGSSRLGASARERIDNGTVTVSQISLLELSVKVSIGKLESLPDLHRILTENGVEPTGIEERFLQRLETLPLHHRDPFDRLIIAQALVDKLAVVTADGAFAQYGVQVVDARE